MMIGYVPLPIILNVSICKTCNNITLFSQPLTLQSQSNPNLPLSKLQLYPNLLRMDDVQTTEMF